MSTPFPFGHAAADHWRDALEQALAACAWEGFPSTLGFLYLNEAYEPALAEMMAALQEATGVQDWVGSVGIGVAATNHEYLDTPALALLFTDLPKSEYRLFAGMDAYESEELRLDDGRQAALAIVHADAHSQDLPEQVRHLAARCSSGFLMGGVTSSRGQGAQLAGRVLHGGLSGVAFSDQVMIRTRLSQGCTPIGPVHRIQEAERNIVATLDRRSALEVLYDEVGEVLARDIRRAAGFIFAALPLAGSDQGDYLVRNLVGVDEQNGLVAIGDYVESGAELMFCKRDGDSAHADLQRMLADLQKLAAGRAIRGAIYVSCLGRGESLFGANSIELRLISKILGDVPLVGFFANGEIYHDRIYGYTGVLTLFLE
ncbi:FIST C-terminal domain-containing protein [Acidithiobacillus sp. IBUN Pt1247-S3]|uniref:FIST signal transduction protein n=1 Tax=Acidithiobacillus sp. IBUN Pt1247-S3 TaxID=3166642 RepID=UPI0034E3819D